MTPACSDVHWGCLAALLLSQCCCCTLQGCLEAYERSDQPLCVFCLSLVHKVPGVESGRELPAWFNAWQPQGELWFLKTLGQRGLKQHTPLRTTRKLSPSLPPWRLGPSPR